MRVIKIILRKIKRLLIKVFGSKIEELYWEFRHIFDKKWTENYISEESINQPQRKFLIEKISNYYPFNSVLEIGCASGPNLYLLAKKFSEVKFYGIDISKKAIKIGKEYSKEGGIKNIFLSTNKAENLKQFSNKSIDIIFTSAILIYIGPDKISDVIKEILRVASRAIIINEWHSNSPKSFYNGHWIHNYKLLLTKFVSEEKIKFTKLPPELWSGSWSKYGYIIEVVL